VSKCGKDETLIALRYALVALGFFLGIVPL
jgi:hypothetical protein